MLRNNIHAQGFTLIQISILLTVAALAIVTVLSGHRPPDTSNAASHNKTNAILPDITAGGHGYYRPITIDYTKVGTVNHTYQTNFPVLFEGTYPYLATTAHGGSVQNSNGYDITFTSDAAGNIPLPFERESWDSGTGASVFWIQVPNVSASANTAIYLHYGNSSITTDQSDKNGTWNNNYAAVWHLDETNGTQYDSTSHNNYLAGGNWNAQGETAAAAIGGADEETSNSQGVFTQAAINDSLLEPATFTMQIWARMTAWNPGYPSMIIETDTASAPWTSYGLGFDPDQHPCIFWINTSSTWYNACGTTAASLNTWYSLTGTYDSNSHTLAIYVNGALAGTATTTGTMYKLTDEVVGIGFNYNISPAQWPAGYFDETRISDTVLSADWIATEYNNESAPDKDAYGTGGFYTVGTQISQ